jgi:hypothetical protein
MNATATATAIAIAIVRIRRRFKSLFKNPLRHKFKSPLRNKFKNPLKNKFKSLFKSPLRNKFKSLFKNPLRHKFKNPYPINPYLKILYYFLCKKCLQMIQNATHMIQHCIRYTMKDIKRAPTNIDIANIIQDINMDIVMQVRIVIGSDGIAVL